ncbi:hypothetical protein T310_9055, partial [Rasamsonia emersonii CBS 393.64]
QTRQVVGPAAGRAVDQIAGLSTGGTDEIMRFARSCSTLAAFAHDGTGALTDPFLLDEILAVLGQGRAHGGHDSRPHTRPRWQARRTQHGSSGGGRSG